MPDNFMCIYFPIHSFTPDTHAGHMYLYILCDFNKSVALVLFGKGEYHENFY